MDWDAVDWEAVHRLRDGFLSGQAGRGDYWQHVSDLRTYDETFAARIGWKWRFVLDDLARLGWSPPAGVALDWGCGTGIASRLVGLRWPGAMERLALSDRSALAVRFAADRAREALPGVAILTAGDRDAGILPACREGVPPSQTPANAHDVPSWSNQRGRDARVTENVATLIVSHVLGELNDGALQGLLALARRAQAVVWVEPGTHEISRRLIDVREKLRDEFAVVAPCTHQAVCGMLAAGNERHWCHHFAPAPPEIHTDGNWRKFGILAGIDLRALPLSYLVLDRRAAHCVGAEKGPPRPPGAHRVIGRPRVYKAYAHLFGCDESGVRDYRLMKRHDPDAFGDVKRERSDTLQIWQTEGTEILHAEPLR
ncbi:MAG: small ribosomal subunit Rsm22 family protein [Phycisphaerae bacterium]|nr:small ribosomal subunit Rsm22 family protein [Phycisphaerae bacterium]